MLGSALPLLLLPALLRAAPPPSLPAILEDARARTGVPALAAAVVRDGKIVASGVTGVREVGEQAPVTKEDRWVIGSCTKPMTRLLLARLVEQGKLRFDTSLADAFPGLPMQPAYRKATLVDVMRHTAGLPPYTRIGPKLTPFVFALEGTPAERRTAFAAHVLQEPPAGEVGRFVYSNAGFALLGSVLERLAGRPWEALMASEVFEPLGMGSAVIGLTAARASGPMPTGHARDGTGFRAAPDGPPVEGVFAPAGGVVLGIEDFARFAVAQVAAEAGKATALLGASTAAELPGLRPADADRHEGATFLGGQGTYTAGFAVWPSKQFGVVVATNAGDSDEVVEAVVDALRAAFAPELPALARPGPGPGPGGPRLGLALRGEEDGQLVVDGVAPGSPAQQAGLRAEDRIVAIDGKAVKDLGRDGVLASLRRPGARLSVLRAGKPVEILLPR